MTWVAALAMLLAVIAAWALASRALAHRPAAIALTAHFASECVRAGLQSEVLQPARSAGLVPFEGLTRAVFHMDQWLFVCGIFWPAALMWWVLSHDLMGPIACASVAFVYCAVQYPALRGEHLGDVYRAITVFACIFSVAPLAFERVRSRARSQREALVVPFFILAGLVATLLGPYLGSPFRHWWTAALTWTIVSAAITANYGRLLWRTKLLR